MPPPTVAELPGPPHVAEPLALLPVAVAGASLLLHFPLLVAVEPLLLLPVTGHRFLLL